MTSPPRSAPRSATDDSVPPATPEDGLPDAVPGAVPAPRDEEPLSRSLRPRRLHDFVGMSAIKEALEIAIAAAKNREEPVDHVLFYGPPGLGKTTLAAIVAAEMGVSLRTTSGPAITRPGDLASILTSLQAGDVLFIDECHRLARGVEEVLYPVMEDFALDLVIGKGAGARSVRLAIQPFTLVAATTRYALLSPPLRERFGAVFRVDFYAPDELSAIVRANAAKLAIEISDEGARTLAERSRGTPRIANRLLRRARDFAQVRADGAITAEVADEALARLQIDALGLDDRDRVLLRALIERFEGGPVGLETLSSAIAEEPDTVMDVYEPYLLQLGFLQRTPRGRVAMPAAFDYLGTEAPAARQPSLFAEGEAGDEAGAPAK